MKKYIAIAVALVALLIAYFYLVPPSGYIDEVENANEEVTEEETSNIPPNEEVFEEESEQQEQTQTDPVTTIELTGKVVNIDASQMEVDGPAIVTIRMQNGGTYDIRVPSGETQCVARDTTVDVFELNEGMIVEVRGETSVTSGPVITPCASEDHYLRIVSE